MKQQKSLLIGGSFVFEGLNVLDVLPFEAHQPEAATKFQDNDYCDSVVLIRVVGTPTKLPPAPATVLVQLSQIHPVGLTEELDQIVGAGHSIAVQRLVLAALSIKRSVRYIRCLFNIKIHAYRSCENKQTIE